ncbi:MAG: threonylcarbamoyl-AMP synthase [Anaerolineales bacterium]|nr:threonylcarbamoyl-AMP synthase [Anaerolineales bacterium]
MDMLTQILPADDPRALQEAVKLLRQGELVAFPTDTVYGLGAMVFDAQAIEQLYMVKQRDSAKAIAVLIGSLAHLSQITAEMGEMALRLAQHFWPGPLTLVVLRHPLLPANISPRPTVGVRMPDHPTALHLLNRAGPLAVTSANLSGEESANTAQEVFDQLEGRIPLILDAGSTPGGSPSTVVDCTGAQLALLRQGPIPLERLLEVIS